MYLEDVAGHSNVFMKTIGSADPPVKLGADGVAIRVACNAAGPMGFVTIDCDSGHLDQLCVAPDFWGKGVSEALVADARRISPSGLHLAVNADNPRAVRFYERQGFVETGRGSNPRSGLPIVFMSWPGAKTDADAT